MRCGFMYDYRYHECLFSNTGLQKKFKKSDAPKNVENFAKLDYNWQEKRTNNVIAFPGAQILFTDMRSISFISL